MKYIYLFAFFSFSLLAFPPKPQFISKIYSSTEGLSNNIVSAITQDKEGYLWIGTYGGLNRYDGKEFRKYSMSDKLVFDAVRSLYSDKDGTLWIGTELGLSMIKNGEIISSPLSKKFKGRDIRVINGTEDGTIYAGTTKGLIKFQNNNSKKIKTFNGIGITSIYIGKNGLVWIGTKNKGLYTIDKDEKEEDFHIEDEVISISEDENSNIVVSYKNKGIILYTVSGKMQNAEFLFPAKNFNQKNRYLICKSHLDGKLSFLSQVKESYFHKNNNYEIHNIENINTCFIDREGTIWVGTYGAGLVKYYERRVMSFNREDGLTDAGIRYIFKDSRNKLWLGTQTNITKFENNKFTTITTFKDRAISKARVILEDESNRVWFGTESGLLYLEENEFHEVKNNNGDSLNVYSMDIFNGSLFVLEANKKIQQINLNNENDLKVEKKPIGFEKKNTIEVLWKIESSRGENFKKELYLQSSERILKYDSLKRKFITFLLKSNLVGLPKLQAFFPTGGENFLVGDNRLFFMENGKVIKELTVKEGLPEGEIVSIVNEPDKKENLWIGTSKGLVYYHDGKIIIFDQNDGLANDFCHFNSIAIDSEYVYIGTNDGISVVDRKKINKNEIAPNVHFTKLKTNKKIIKSNFQSETFEYDENTIQLDGASLSFIVPERTRYQFSKISESETEVFPLQNNATMTFFNLKPGKYRFTIQGTNNDDMMSTNQEEIQVEIKPAFWQTWYFITGVSLITLGFAYGVYSLRVYQIKQENIKLEKLVKQRTKELFAEKETSERLLLNVLPKNIAERLKKGESTIADSFHEVSVLFADIVGFTKLSQTISPQELVSRLNDLFTMFDKIALDLNVEKIKTIGDCYMAVAGLPLERADHAILIIEMAKKMLSAIEDFNLRHNASLSVRIGINTGEVVAGVIGKHKFIYDLWGDAVNTASRMESHGVPGRIHLSESTYKALKDKYDFESRGEMEIKGKGKMTTYLLNS